MIQEPNILEAARNIATVIAVIVAVAVAFPAFLNLRASERSLRSRVYNDTLVLLDGDYVRTLRHVLEDALNEAKDQKKTFDILTASTDIKDKLDTLARQYDKAGLLVKHGVVPTDFLFDFYSRPIALAWTHISPLILDIRRSRSQPGHMMKFQVLAVGAALYRQKAHGETPAFTIAPEDEMRWKSWKPWRNPSSLRTFLYRHLRA